MGRRNKKQKSKRERINYRELDSNHTTPHRYCIICCKTREFYEGKCSVCGN